MLSGWQSALDPHGAEAIALRDLIGLFTGVCTAVWLAVVAALIWAALRRPATAAETPEPDTHPRAASERRLGIAVGASLALTVLIITGLTLASFFATRGLTANAGDVLRIRLKAFQWWWEVAYLDSDPSRVLLSANEIHVPVGRPVRIELVGADVIHSFWVPSLAGKQDLIPGRPNEIGFTAERPGIYRGQCAEFCGLGHARMAFMVVAQARDEFERWRAAQLVAAEPPGAGEVRLGHEVFTTRPCAACHTVRGTAAAGTLGPDLTHVASRQTIAAGLLPTTPGALAAWIADPQTLKPGSNMPIVPLSPLELRAVTAYMASLR